MVGLAAGERSFATSKLFFAYALEHGLLGPLATGATAILEPGLAGCGDRAGRWSSATGRHAFFSVPTFYRQLLALGAERLAPFRARASLRRAPASGCRRR